LRIQEEKRQQKAVKVRQITERQDVQVYYLAKILNI
jgi:DNA-binding IscR family transcriptional regulator